jgi:hypothetical protein
MTLILPPSIRFQSVSFGIRYNSQNFASPLNGFTQSIELPGAKWFATYNVRPYRYAEAAPLRAFLAKLRGRANTFYGYDPAALLLGAGGGTPLINGAGQTGSTLVIDGAPINMTGWLRESDYFEVNGELKMVTEDVHTNGSGQATIIFEPPLRYIPADNAPLNITSPRCKMQLVDDDAALWPTSPGRYQTISFSAIEVLRDA